jgi:Ni/Co efflux regulator RcnB
MAGIWVSVADRNVGAPAASFKRGSAKRRHGPCKGTVHGRSAASRVQMKKLMTGALALALLASTGVASAQDGQFNSHARRGALRSTPEGDRRASQPPQAPPAPQAQTPPAAPQAGVRDDRRGGDRDRGDRDRGDRDGRDRGGHDGRDRDGRDRDGRGRDGRDWNGRDDDRGRDERHRDRRDWNDGRNWQDSRRWDDPRRHQPRPRYDRRRYDPIWRSQQRYRGWVYRPPSGFYARSWVFGDVVPRTWWGPDYRILDWWSYGLPIPPAGYEWVRVGDDALLIDMYSGRVVQVAYDLFW